MKLYAHLPYIIPKNYFLGNSEKNDRKNSFFSKLELRKNSFMSQKISYTFCSTSHVKTFLASFHRTVFLKKSPKIPKFSTETPYGKFVLEKVVQIFSTFYATILMKL